MKTKLLLLSLFSLNCAFAHSNQLPQQNVKQETQDQVAIHRVALGETVVLIAKKYMVLPKDIYELNPDAINGLSTGMGLRIPVNRKVKTEVEAKNLDYEIVDAATLRKAPAEKKAVAEYVTPVEKKQSPENFAQPAAMKQTVVAAEVKTQPSIAETTAPSAEVAHDVKPGETLTALAQKYNTTIKAITEANTSKLKRGLQAGQTLVIPAQPGAQVAEVTAPVTTTATTEEAQFTGTHKVKSGETLTGVARKYNTTIDAIAAANEKMLKRGLQAGQTLVIPAASVDSSGETGTAVAAAEPVIVPNHASYADEADGTTEHKVEAGETLTGLARKYNTTIEAITAANKQKLKRGLQAGQTLTIPVAAVTVAAHVEH